MDYIVEKPDGITAEAYEQIKRHVDVEEYVGDSFEQLPARLREHIICRILGHYECFNGSGYLKGKSGARIAFSGRLTGVVDVYKALARRQAYKSIVRPEDVMHLLYTVAERALFDRKIHQTFYSAMGRYPLGSVVNATVGWRSCVVRIRAASTRWWWCSVIVLRRLACWSTKVYAFCRAPTSVSCRQ